MEHPYILQQFVHIYQKERLEYAAAQRLAKLATPEPEPGLFSHLFAYFKRSEPVVKWQDVMTTQELRMLKVGRQ
jgi:hypothetical protein